GGEGVVPDRGARRQCRSARQIAGGLGLLAGLLDLEGEAVERVGELRVAKLLGNVRLLGEGGSKVVGIRLGRAGGVRRRVGAGAGDTGGLGVRGARSGLGGHLGDQAGEL